MIEWASIAKSNRYQQVSYNMATDGSRKSLRSGMGKVEVADDVKFGADEICGRQLGADIAAGLSRSLHRSAAC